MHVDVRIIAATHQNLEERIQDKTFREDLFYRLNVIPIDIPPLRERPDDVPALVETFLRRHQGERSCYLTPEAMRKLMAHSWRGNARELENVIERALALSDGESLDVGDIPLPDSGANGGAQDASFLRRAALGGTTLDDLGEQYTQEVLDLVGGNKVRAAALLGIDRKTLYRRAERRERKCVQGA